MNRFVAAIFDVDDTLLDNRIPGLGNLHQISRLEATHEIARKYNISTLLSVSMEKSTEYFLAAKEHSAIGATWQMLYDHGLVDADEVDYDNKLLSEIVNLKDDLHADILRRKGKPVEGSIEFIELLSNLGMLDFAIASSATRRDIDIFLDEITDLRRYFPRKNVVAREDIEPGKNKPHPHVFEKALRSMSLKNVSNYQVLAFEDDPRGVISAKSVGLYTVAITTRMDKYSLLEAGADLVVDNYDELSGLMS